MKKILKWLGIKPEEFKWWYLITTPIIFILGCVAFVFIYTVLIYWLMSIGGATP